MYSLIKNMAYSRWLVGVAAVVLVGVGARHMATVSNLNANHDNRPLQRSVNLLMSSVLPRGTGASVQSAQITPLQLNACSASELETLNRRLAQLDDELAAITGIAGTGKPGNRLTEVPYALDSGALQDQVRMATSDGGPYEFRCTSLIRAADWLLRKGALSSRLASATASGRSRETSAASGASPRLPIAALKDWNFRSRDPWGDLPGCILLSDAKGYTALPPANEAASARLCESAFPSGSIRMSPRSHLPVGVEQLRLGLASVAPKTQSTGNTVEVLGRSVPQGPHYLTTLKSDVQEIAQQTAQCYTGDHGACQTLGIDTARWQSRYEKAAVRMAGVLVLDIQSGAIEAAGSAHTKCFAQEFDGPGRDLDCVPLPPSPRARGYELENHALHTSYMPGSLIKPILAMGLLNDPKLAARLHGAERNKFLYEIRRSNSVAFLDRLFCRDTNFENCSRPSYAIDAALALGWNGHCGDGSDKQCARVGALTGAPEDELSVLTGRFALVHDKLANSFKRMNADFDADKARECSGQAGKAAWRRCKGGHLVDLESEAWGQGSAMASPVGVAVMLSRLGAAADNSKDQASVPRPHLFESVLVQHNGALQTTAVEPVRDVVSLRRRDAQLVLAGMAQSHLPAKGALEAGTAYSACLQAYGSSTACASLRHIAGKTGTPPFGHDMLRAKERMDACAPIRAEMPTATNERLNILRARWTDCSHRPIKWYGALLKDPQALDGPWQKVVVVIVERNWATNGVIDSPGDIGPNAAAELAFQVIRRIAPQVATVSR